MYELVVFDGNEYDNVKTIDGNEFSLFLELCFENAEFFSLNEAVWTNSICRDLQTELEPF